MQLKKNIPIFAVVLSEATIFKKASIIGKANSIEVKEIDKYKEFKELVYGKVVREVEDIQEIKLSIHRTLNEFN
jgi:hypothetical protein